MALRELARPRNFLDCRFRRTPSAPWIVEIAMAASNCYPQAEQMLLDCVFLVTLVAFQEIVTSERYGVRRQSALNTGRGAEVPCWRAQASRLRSASYGRPSAGN